MIEESHFGALGEFLVALEDSHRKQEEKVIDARLTVASLKDGTLCAMQKGGNTPLRKEEILKMVDIAVDKAKELRGALLWLKKK